MHACLKKVMTSFYRRLQTEGVQNNMMHFSVIFARELLLHAGIDLLIMPSLNHMSCDLVNCLVHYLYFKLEACYVHVVCITWFNNLTKKSHCQSYSMIMHYIFSFMLARVLLGPVRCRGETFKYGPCCLGIWELVKMSN